MSTTYCEQCGTAVNGSGSFCRQCGSAVATATEPRLSVADRPRPAAGPPPTNTQPHPQSTAMRGIVSPGRGSRARSRAWIYYAILAVLSVISAVAGKPIGLLGTVLFGAYSYYIYQGGRIVIWFW